MDADSRTLALKGGAIHYTRQEAEHYRVESGQVLVYIVPLQQDRPLRRILLCEAGPGRWIPSLAWQAPLNLTDDTLCLWCFGLVAVDEARLSRWEGPLGEADRQAFLQDAGVRGAAFLEFGECCVEQYQLHIAKELRNIYTAEREQARTRARSLEAIYRLFGGGLRRPAREPTGHPLYDAAAVLCDRAGIPLQPLETVQAGCGRNFSVEDLARLSHCICRDILLEPGWEHWDCGPVLAFTAEGNHPVACLPRGPRRYEVYDPGTGTLQPLTARRAAALAPRAKMFYRPFPAKALGFRDVAAFGLQAVRRRDVATFVGLSLAGTAIGLLLPYINQQLYDLFLPLGDIGGLMQIGWVILACLLGSLTFSIVKNLATLRSTSGIQYTIEAAVYDRLFNLPESFFRGYDSADLAQRAMAIGPLFRGVVQMLLGTGLTAVCSLLYLWRMFGYSAVMSVWALGMLAAAAAVILLLGWWQTRCETQLATLQGQLSSRLYQLLGGIDKLRMAGVEDRALYEYLKPYTEARRLTMEQTRIGNLAGLLSGLMSGAFSLVLYSVAIHQLDASLTMGAFMGFTAAFGAFSAAVLQAVSAVLTLNDLIPLYDRSRPVLETLPELEENTGLPGELTGDIELNGITFGYSPDSAPVLRDLSLHIHPGEYLGIVGPSGCGKSTLLKLLLGFEKPQSGKIFYDGQDIERLDKRELRKKFGVVLQDGQLISGSIYDNITITAPGVTPDRVREVIRDVGLEEDIARMPMGLHTVLSEGSGTISGGQQQRILIARAIVGKPRILFFDEATSALDNVTQRQVSDSLAKLHATRVVIAHRLSTIRQCDRILVLEGGTVREEGRYEELMARKGLFYALASRQMS